MKVKQVFLLMLFPISMFFLFLIPLSFNLAEVEDELANIESYVIIAMFRNNEEILDHWISELFKLMEHLRVEPYGTKKIYISIIENNDSTDKTIEKLESFKTKLLQLSIPHTIETQKVIVFNRVTDRISRLVELRNYSLKPLQELNFDPKTTRIIYFNDIHYQSTDIIRLLRTNQGNYDMACGLDFYWQFYDAWVTRDLSGSSLRGYYPYFEDNVAQQQVRSGKPVRVFSCWNGVVVMKAEPLMDRENPLKFRVSNRLATHSVYDSECFSFSYDLWDRGYHQIYINPNVRVTYHWRHYFMQNYIFPWSWDIYNDLRNIFQSYKCPPNPDSASTDKITMDRSVWSQYT
eukprot:TRINITY_DN10563_c0_g1_i1.p1 TRINITY_DN10563_c0_g1~~TRINITY_DN10563_c0_g1_i1.p1  ORF type:complete len:347 (-),score=25.36 TRINITY_DN10563_c0_g1_i1:368-1408(-)